MSVSQTCTFCLSNKEAYLSEGTVLAALKQPNSCFPTVWENEKKDPDYFLWTILVTGFFYIKLESTQGLL